MFHSALAIKLSEDERRMLWRSLSLSRQRKSKQSLAQISTAKGRVTAATATTFGVDEGQNFDKKAKNEGHKGQKEGPSE